MHCKIPLLLGLTLSFAACGPDLSAIDNQLRAKNLALTQENQQLQGRLDSAQATNQNLQDQLDQRLPRVETLRPDRLAQLFTMEKIEIRSITDAWDIRETGRLDGFRVFLRPLMENDYTLPATGDVTIDAFDLADTASPHLGTWKFTPADCQKNWYGGFGLNQLAFNCPWAAPPKHSTITFKVRFVDALTGRVFPAQTNITVHLQPVEPAATAATNP